MVQCAFFTKSQSHAGTFGKAWTLSGFAWKSGGRGFPGGKENPIQPPRRAFSARRDGQIAIRQQISNICSNKLRKNDKICPQKAKFMLDFSKSSAIINSAVRPESAGVAQPVEQLICNQQVGGSNPSTSSSLFRTGRRREIAYGGIPERSNGADCKSVVDDFGGSNPSRPTKKK